MSGPLIGFPDFRWCLLPNGDTLISGRGWWVLQPANEGGAANLRRLWALLRQTHA